MFAGYEAICCFILRIFPFLLEADFLPWVFAAARFTLDGKWFLAAQVLRGRVEDASFVYYEHLFGYLSVVIYAIL